MKLERVKIKWPVALNTVDDKRVLLPKECSENCNLITLPNGDIRGHYLWGNLQISDTDTLINGIDYTAVGEPDKIMVFGHDTNGGFIGMINKGTGTLTKLLTSMGRYRLPQFVKYKDTIYLFNVLMPDYSGVPKLDPNTGIVVGSSLPRARVGCSHRGRLFLANFMDYDIENHLAPGTLKFTGVGDETIDVLNWFEVDLADESVNNLSPEERGILLGKGNKLYELRYTSLVAGESDAKINLLSSEAGVLSHATSQKVFDQTFFYNERGVYLYSPRGLRANPEQIVEISPRIYKISKPIDDIISDMFKATEMAAYSAYKRTTDQGSWSINDFQVGHTYNLEIGYFTINTVNHYGVRLITGPVGGWWQGSGISEPIDISSVGGTAPRWTKLVAKAWRYVSGEEIKLYISNDMSTWHILPSTLELAPGFANVYNQIWDTDIYQYVVDVDVIYFKVEIRHLYREDLGYMAFFTNLELFGQEISTELFGSGYHKDRFYVFGKNSDGDHVALGYKDGWMRFNESAFETYNLINRVIWHDDYDIIGFAKDSNGGCLVKDPIPENQDGNMTIIGETGNVDYDKADVPKKLRRIFITYKGAGISNLKIYGEDDILIKSIKLPAKTDFGIEEIGIQSDRSKWHRYKITATKADFALKSLDADVKAFGSSEV